MFTLPEYTIDTCSNNSMITPGEKKTIYPCYLPRIFIQINPEYIKLDNVGRLGLKRLWNYGSSIKLFQSSFLHMISSFHRTILPSMTSNLHNFPDFHPNTLQQPSNTEWLNSHLGFPTPLPWWSAGMVSSNSKSGMAGNESMGLTFLRDRGWDVFGANTSNLTQTVLEVL